ncbi:putative piggyBac transposable element-derived protein 3-like [Triplophysa rosa]|uniref:PiggyBac transposable element-derived protein 3-like n=1 Tax=Triplophysa rosa TaxID=992332 RepID=A0A9W7W9Z3_TRIRA|nr:putative piggyBac transposable element-derived protein 3-like [Triplophysa rosa]
MICLFGHVTKHIYFLVLTSYRKDDIKAQKGQTDFSQVLDLLYTDDPEPGICNIAVVPKIEKDAIQSDCDSDASDMDLTGDSAHIPSRILNSTAELFGSDHFEEIEPECEDQPKLKIQTRNLSKKLEAASSSLLPSSDATTATMPVPLAEKIQEPACGDQPRLTIRTRKLTKQLEAAFFKVRPIFQELNTSYKILPFSKWLSVDESMIPYYGRHGYKQFIKGKPIRYSYKV